MTLIILILAQANGLTVPPLCWVLLGGIAVLRVIAAAFKEGA